MCFMCREPKRLFFIFEAPVEFIAEQDEKIMRIWGKLWQDNHLLRDMVVEDRSDDTRTHKVFHALTEICQEFDLAEPIWLDANVKDFQRHAKTRFGQDSFIETIEFDALEIQVIEE